MITGPWRSSLVATPRHFDLWFGTRFTMSPPTRPLAMDQVEALKASLKPAGHGRLDAKVAIVTGGASSVCH